MKNQRREKQGPALSSSRPRISPLVLVGCLIGSLGIAAGQETTLSITLDPQKVPTLTVYGPIGGVNQIEYSATLSATSQWTAVSTLSLTSNPVRCTDTSAPTPGPRYYRSLVITTNNPDPQGLVWIPPGVFVMGTPSNEVDRLPDEGPPTSVKLAKGFFMAKYEVTQEQWLSLMGSNPSFFTGDLHMPVGNVTWFDATNYCSKLTAIQSQQNLLPSGFAYRLPTEAEWEYACRAGSTTRFSYGDDLGYQELTFFGWYADNSSATTHPVGKKQTNPWGLYDMHGNAWEWCSDFYAETLPGGFIVDPKGPEAGTMRVFRSGSWNNTPLTCRSGKRGRRAPDGGGSGIGFRVVLSQ